ESIVGSAIDLDGEPWTVIGVLPPGFRYGRTARDLYVPLTVGYADPRGDRRLEVIARLEEGVGLEQAAQELRGIASTLASTHPRSNAEWGVRVQPLDRYLLGEEARQNQLVLLGAAALLLLLACVNVSNLLLARGADRAGEIELRLALGASSGRVRRQLMLESLVLGLLGGAIAAGLAFFIVPWVRSLDVSLPRLHEVSFGPRSLIFLLLSTLAASLLFGLVQALRPPGGTAAAPRARRHGSSVAGSRTRSLLVMAEVALALVLAFGAGLLLRSFEQLRAFDSGLDTSPKSGAVYLATIDLPAERYPEGDSSTRLFFGRLSDALAARPTVEAVGASMVSPFGGMNTQNVVADESETELKAFHQVRWRSMTPNYFDAVGATLLRGRTHDTRGERGPLETVISESLAERLWPGRDPIGERLRWRLPEGVLLEVVGVVADLEDVALGADPMPTMYWSQHLMGWSSMTVAIRTHEPAEAVAAALREALTELDPLLAMPPLETLEGNYRRALARPLLSLRLVSLSALLALVMAAAGVYGLVAYAVSQRRREMGVRAALGARPGQLVARVVRDAAKWVVGGLAAGLLASLGLMHSLRLLLYETSPFDPGVLATSVAVLALVGLLACAVPAARAGQIDPISALREE
ncbi:MAG: FtsX-like permease family protein, partial [Acidobacteriota bacterium]